ncbi:flagellar motor protein MotB [Demequina capsici]|uniref:Flagellar motor protein MotB n=1 Tax=Demequina capsici TaxID=3075620 RepID=A0AA96FDK0_9MICO|nr:flagellar motor protein MotB [Demequina sp. PMTSA13]WNM27412.1 flagellar motor protein MotB [Demequina sp. PMTSA13]
MSRKHEEEEHENHERWAVSYADMMTVLLALFIVLYAISVVDKTKFEELRQSLAIGFGKEAPSVIEGSNGTLTGLDSFQVAPDFTGVAHSGSDGNMDSSASANSDTQLTQDQLDYLKAAAEYEDLNTIQQNLEQTLTDQGLAADVTFQIDERGLIIGLVGSNVFFAPDDAEMTDIARRVVDTLAGPLATQPRQLSVEGHANVIPSSHYATNWELSSDRAVQVLRRFVEANGLPPDRISATGFGDSRPVADGMSDEALAANRRVDIVVESAASEEIRAMLPDIAKAIEDGTVTHESLQAQLAALRVEGMGDL